MEVLDEVGHLAPVEAPEQVADLILSRINTRDNVYEAGIAVRREVLGDAHVDRIIAEKTDFTSDFEDMITRYAWGSVWTRPGLDRRSRSMITLSALVACGHPDYLPMHLRAARRNGLSNDEIKELLMHLAIYVGVPEVNYAFQIAKRCSPTTTKKKPHDDAPQFSAVADGRLYATEGRFPRAVDVVKYTGAGC